MINYDRIIITNLPNEKKYCEMLASVVAQLSDGAWENSSKAIPYWKFAECNSRNNNICVSKKFYIAEDYYYYKKEYRNPYWKMSDEDIKHYFARKIKELALMEMKQDYEDEIKEQFLGDFSPYEVPIDRYNEWKEKNNEYQDYISKHPFIAKGKFVKDNDYELTYIAYDERITVADAYEAYKILMK